MRLLNETLSDLKVYARKNYSLTKNVPILVMVISEQEHKVLTETYTKLMQTHEGNTTASDGSDVENSPIISDEFFSNVAGVFELVHIYSKETKLIVTPMLRDAFDIPHFRKYMYAIMIREEKLIEWGNQMDIQVNGVQTTGKIRKILICYRVLTQEFLHVVEREKGIQIFTGDEGTDSEVVHQAINSVKVFRDTDIFSD